MHNQRIWDGDDDGFAVIDMGCYEYGADPVGLEDPVLEIPGYNLHNYPNPFNPSTKISFNLPTEIEGEAEISIYSLKGQKVKTFSNLQITQSPNQQIVWDGTDQTLKPVSSGIYFARIIAGSLEANCKMLLLK